MPVYEYRCPECEHEFERFESIRHDGTGVTCPSCGAAYAERIPSRFASTSSAAVRTGGACRTGST